MPANQVASFKILQIILLKLSSSATRLALLGAQTDSRPLMLCVSLGALKLRTYHCCLKQAVYNRLCGKLGKVQLATCERIFMKTHLSQLVNLLIQSPDILLLLNLEALFYLLRVGDFPDTPLKLLIN